MTPTPGTRRRSFRLLVAAATAIAGTALTIPAAAAMTPASAPAAAPASSRVVPQLQAAGLASTIALSNCSGSLARYPSSLDSDRAMMLTNGHCYEGGFLAAGQVLQNRTSTRRGTLLSSTGTALGTLTADRVLYATMTGTDITLYRLTRTFASIQSSFGVTARTISASHPVAGDTFVPSGFFSRVFDCNILTFVPTLREDRWTWHDSIRYDTNCDTNHGTSGSPIVDASSGQIVGINNTGNDDGEMCTLDNPCEVDANGTTHAYQGQSYGEETYWFTTCLNSARTIDLTISGCLLTKPAS